jgi:hypothetical protein
MRSILEGLARKAGSIAESSANRIAGHEYSGEGWAGSTWRADYGDVTATVNTTLAGKGRFRSAVVIQFSFDFKAEAPEVNAGPPFDPSRAAAGAVADLLVVVAKAVKKMVGKPLR